MKLTLRNRLKICFEVLTIRGGRGCTAQEKQLSTFLRGYYAGMEDQALEDYDLFEYLRYGAKEPTTHIDK